MKIGALTCGGVAHTRVVTVPKQHMSSLGRGVHSLHAGASAAPPRIWAQHRLPPTQCGPRGAGRDAGRNGRAETGGRNQKRNQKRGNQKRNQKRETRNGKPETGRKPETGQVRFETRNGTGGTRNGNQKRDRWNQKRDRCVLGTRNGTGEPETEPETGNQKRDRCVFELLAGTIESITHS